MTEQTESDKQDRVTSDLVERAYKVEISQSQEQQKQECISFLEIVIVSLFAITWAFVVAAMFHISQWQFYLHCLTLGVVVWRCWSLPGKVERTHPLDELIGYSIGGMVVLSALASHISGWSAFLYIFLVGFAGSGVGLCRFLIKDNLSRRSFRA